METTFCCKPVLKPLKPKHLGRASKDPSPDRVIRWSLQPDVLITSDRESPPARRCTGFNNIKSILLSAPVVTCLILYALKQVLGFLLCMGLQVGCLGTLLMRRKGGYWKSCRTKRA